MDQKNALDREKEIKWEESLLAKYAYGAPVLLSSLHPNRGRAGGPAAPTHMSYCVSVLRRFLSHFRPSGELVMDPLKGPALS